MRNQDHSAGPLHEILFQPLDTLDVEVVGGLVEQQHIGLPQQEFRQFNTHTPATAQLAGRAVKLGALEAQTEERTFHLSMEIQTTHHLEVLFGTCVTIYEGQIIFALVVSTLGHLSIHPVDIGLQVANMVKGQQRLLHHRTFVGQLHHLRKITNRRITRNSHDTLCGRLLSSYDFQECRFPRTVLARQRYAVAISHDKTHVREQRTGTEFNGKMFYGNHTCD